MKKIILSSLVFVLALSTKVNAQDSKKEIEIISWPWVATSTTTGTQSVPVPGGKGTVKFTRQGDRFTNVVFVDAAGKTHRLQPIKPGTNGAPDPGCKYPIPDACFGTANKNIGMCMCKPTDLTSTGGGEYSISLLLPAVQKVRDAAAKSRQ
jgi:hypothetical protein